MNRQRQYQRTLKAIGRTLLLTAMLLCTAAAHAQERKKVIIACDWDFAPYEFINNEGRADGFNIEVIHSILKELGIPHEFTMNARKQCIEAYTQLKADLIVDFRNRFADSLSFRTRSSLGYYQTMVAHRKSIPGYSDPDKLKRQGTIYANGNNDSIYRKVLDYLPEDMDLQFRSAREALAGIINGNYNYFIWGEELLKWKIKEYNLEGIVLTKLNVPITEIHILGHDKELIDEIDSLFARLQQSGEIDHIIKRWFQPEAAEKVTSSTAILIILSILLITCLMAILVFMNRRSVRKAIRKNEDTEAMLHQALKMGNFSVMVYNLRRGLVTSLHRHLLPEEGVSLTELLDNIHPADKEQMNGIIQSIASNHEELKYFTIRWNTGKKDDPIWVKVSGFIFPEYDEHGHLINYISTAHDTTEEEEQERKEREMASRYRKMFDSTLVAMSFYDKNGKLVDVNDKMREMVGITPENEAIFAETSMYDFPLIKGDVTPDSLETLHVCQHMYYPERGIDKYIEFRVRPSLDHKGELLYTIITARDITEERSMYLELKQQNKALEVATEDNNRYEREMRTLMEDCKMFIWNMELNTGTITFSQTLGEVLFTRTIEDHIMGMYEDEREDARKQMLNIDAIKKPFNTLHHFIYTPINDTPTWYATSGMPILDQHGNTTALFGIVRDVTELMEAQERLKEETARAENSGILKATFLANMTHEIRTPLNAIVGFSDLLHMVDTTEERKEFIRIIRNNCDMLMRLINDIFEASTLDVKPLEIKLAEVDFAQDFVLTCQSLSQRVQNPAVRFIVENPYESFITIIDKGRIQQVITNFVTNAVKYTEKGHIRVGYRYEDNGLYIYCEDTGAGIPKEKQKSVFDRFVKLNDFVQGTGLGLNICKAIAERSSGRIGVDSEGEGHGSTFWIWVPCHVLSKKERQGE